MAAGDAMTRSFAAYTPDLGRTVRALAVVALGTLAVDLVAARDIAVSLAFLVAGLLVGFGLGRAFARVLYSACEDVPVLEGPGLTTPGPSRLAVAGLAAVALVAVFIPVSFGIPTPLPALCAAGAVQAALAARAVRAIEQIRGGRIVRPVGRVLFDEPELRLIPGEAVTNPGVGSPTIKNPPRAATPRDGGARGG